MSFPHKKLCDCTYTLCVAGHDEGSSDRLRCGLSAIGEEKAQSAVPTASGLSAGLNLLGVALPAARRHPWWTCCHEDDTEADRLVDCRIEHVYGVACHGMQIDIVRFAALFRGARECIADGVTDVELGLWMIEFVKGEAA